MLTIELAIEAGIEASNGSSITVSLVSTIRFQDRFRVRRVLFSPKAVKRVL